MKQYQLQHSQIFKIIIKTIIMQIHTTIGISSFFQLSVNKLTRVEEIIMLSLLITNSHSELTFKQAQQSFKGFRSELAFLILVFAVKKYNDADKCETTPKNSTLMSLFTLKQILEGSFMIKTQYNCKLYLFCKLIRKKLQAIILLKVITKPVFQLHNIQPSFQIMDKQSLSEAISNAKKYAKDLKVFQVVTKHQVSISNPHQVSENSISSDLSYLELTYLHSNSMALYSSFLTKQQNKIQNRFYDFFQVNQPSQSHRQQEFYYQESALNTSSKLSIIKKQVQSENERQNTFNKSQNRLQNKQLSSFLIGSLGSRQIINKKNGHNHTYTHLNNLNSDKYSQIDSNLSTKAYKIEKLRHSKSPSKQRNSQLNCDTRDDDNKSKHANSALLAQRSKSAQKQNWFQAGKLLQQINRLQQIIKKYKSVIMQIKTKYKQMQAKLHQKVIKDHFIDVLKCQIQELQDKNNSLSSTIAQQSLHINQFQHTFIDKITKINQYYSKSIQQKIIIERQNQMLKKILLISSQQVAVGHNASESVTKRQVQSEAKSSCAFEQISKSLQNFNQKWS